MNRFKPPFKSIANCSQNWIQSKANGLSHNSIRTEIENPSQMSSKANPMETNVESSGESTARQVIASDGTRLISVSELPQKYRSVFMSRFPHFNVVQSKAFQEVLETDKSIAICAPTGSGKTVIFELAIIKELIDCERTGRPMSSLKAVYMSPLKKLCDEKYTEFVQSFRRFDLNCLQLTGDSDIEDYEKLRDVNIVLTTPEKWDSMIRNNENNALIKTVRLMLIDEIHTIGDTNRGATVEAVITRIKTLRSVQSQTDNRVKLRFLSASATVSNVDDIAHWLDPHNSIGLNMDTVRPVPLQKLVISFQCQKIWSDFRFDIQLNYKLDSIIRNYSNSKPTLIFCSSRKSVAMTSENLSKSTFNWFSSANQKKDLIQSLFGIKDNKMKACLQTGIGFHHSGLDKKDREIIERLFTRGLLPVLISTTTLAMGVNLPAHLVIIKGTSQYTPNGSHEYPETQLLQMIGRAGRPQFDTSATAIILTKDENKRKYENLLNGNQIIESNLHKNLVEQLNAEVALRTVTSFDIAVQWIRSTFLFIRVLKNPSYYGSNVRMANIEQSLEIVKNWCRTELNELKDSDLIKTNDTFDDIMPTPFGQIMAKHCISLKTMKKFCQMSANELSLKDIIEEISKCDEIRHEIQLRVNEKKILNELNVNSKQPTIRYPMSGRIKSADMKVNCLIQSAFGSMQIQDSTLSQETRKLMRTGQRISRCFADVMYFKVKQNSNQMNCKTLLNAILLNKCFKAKLWHDSSQVALQLNRIGPALSRALADRGIKSFDDIRNADPRNLEFWLKRNPPFGRHLIDEVNHLPNYSMRIEQIVREGIKTSEAVLKIVVKLENFENLKERQVLFKTHNWFLIVGNEENELFFCAKLFDSTLIKNNGFFETKDIVINRNDRSEYISARLISDSFVGLDVECRLSPQFADDIQSISVPNVSNSSHAFSGAWVEPNANNRTELCGHKCLNKTTCLHNCCKKGLNIEKQNESQNQGNASNTSNKRQQNSELKSTKKTKLNRNEANTRTGSLDDWVIRSDAKQKSNQISESETTDRTESVYFRDKKYDKKYSDISDNESNYENELQFNDNTNDNNNQIINDLELDLDNDSDFDEDFANSRVKQMDQNLENSKEKDIFADESDLCFNGLMACNEDFQQFGPNVRSEQMDSMEAMEAMTQNTENSVQSQTIGSDWKRFSMTQWSLFMPTTELEGKTFFSLP